MDFKKTSQNGPDKSSAACAAREAVAGQELNGWLRAGEPAVDVHYKEGESLDRELRALAARCHMHGSDARRMLDEWAVKHPQGFLELALPNIPGLRPAPMRPSREPGRGRHSPRPDRAPR